MATGTMQISIFQIKTFCASLVDLLVNLENTELRRRVGCPTSGGLAEVVDSGTDVDRNLTATNHREDSPRMRHQQERSLTTSDHGSRLVASGTVRQQ